MRITLDDGNERIKRSGWYGGSGIGAYRENGRAVVDGRGRLLVG